LRIRINQELKRRHLASLCYFILSLLLTSCSLETERPLRIGSNNWIGYQPLYLAQKLGHYEETQVKLIELTSSSEVIHALRNGNLEGAGLTLDEALTVIEDGADLKVILVLDFSMGADALLAKPEISSLAELRDKRVAVEYTAVGAILLDGALQKAGVNVTEVDLVSCMLDEHLACYSSVDAIVTFEPVKTQLLNKGARLLFDSSQIPGRIIDVLVVPEKTLVTHPRSLQQLISGYFKARKYLEAEPNAAANLVATRQELTAAEVLTAYDGLHLPSLEENHSLLSGKPIPLQRTAASLVQLMLKKNLLKYPVPVDDLIESRFLPGSNP